MHQHPTIFHQPDAGETSGSLREMQRTVTVSCMDIFKGTVLCMLDVLCVEKGGKGHRQAAI